jgi:hypothetical protein
VRLGVFLTVSLLLIENRHRSQRCRFIRFRARRIYNQAIEFHLMAGFDDGFLRRTVGRFVPRRSLNRPSLKRSRHQLTNFLSAQSDKFTVLVLVKLGTEIKCVYPRVISIEIQK